MQEKEIIESLKRKDEESFNLIYKKYYNLVYFIVNNIIGNDEDSIDITNDTFIKMYEKIDQYRGDSFKYWLLTIAKNLAINFVSRVQNKREMVKVDNEYIGTLPDETNEIGKYDEILKENFTEEERKVIILKVVFNYSFEEIAKTINLNKTTCFRKFNLLMDRFKEIIKKYEQ